MGFAFDDIAFDPSGNLWGLRGNGDIYRIDTATGASSGKTQVVSQFGFKLGGNSMTFAGDGTLYMAGTCILDPVTFAIGLGCISASNLLTGQGTIVGDSGRSPSGDLAFFGGGLYMTSANFSTPTSPDGLLYAVGNTSVYSVDAATAAAVFIRGYTVGGPVQANGASFQLAPVPAPGTAALLLTGLAAFVSRLRRRA